MKELQSQVKELKEIWKRAYKIAVANNAAWKPHLPYSSLVVLDEALETVSVWLDRTRAPSGFSPGYHLAKSLSSVHMSSLLSAAQNIEAAQYNHFPTFVNSLTNLLAAIHTMVVYSPKNDQETLNADFSAELSQSLALLNTAQTELSNKLSLITETEELTDSIKNSFQEIEEFETKIEEIKTNVSDNKKEATNFLETITETLEKSKEQKAEYEELIEKHINDYKKLIDSQTEEYSSTLKEKQQEYNELLDDSKELNDNLFSMSKELNRLQEKCIKQEEIIDSILPRGASAGLAAAFSNRVSQLNPAKWVWMLIFICSLSALSLFAWHITTLDISNNKEFWSHIMSRLPLAAPLVWLGWFSAIQYGNTIRIQEDYAFKEATSKAFQGYKDHMEHLGNIELDEAQTALNLLSETTIKILGHEPLRIYSKTEHDASPTHSFANLIKPKKNKKKPAEEPELDEE